MVAEYEVDEDGNPLNLKPISREDKKSKKNEPKEEIENAETKKKRKRLEKLDRKIKALAKRHEKEGGVKMEHPSDIKNK